MPYLRMPEDNTLAETLGNLGSSLRQAFDPMRQIQAQSTLEEIQQRRFLLGQQQRNDAANQNAANVFRNANPLGMDDASKEAAAVAISQGRYDPSQWQSAVSGVKKFAAAQAASDTVATDPDVQSYTPAEQASVKSLVLNGTPLADAKSQVANERLTAAKTTGALSSRDAARSAASMPGADPEAAVFAGTTALTDQTAAERLIEAQRERIAAAKVPFGTLPSSPLVQEVTSRQLGAGQPVTSPAATQPARTAIEVGGRLAEAQAAPRPAGSVVAPTTFNPATGEVNMTPPNSGPVVAVPAQAPDTQAASDIAAAETTGKAGATYANTILTGGIAEGQGAATVLNDVNQLRGLAKVMNNDGPMTQLQNKLADQMYQRFGLSATPGQSAREVFNNYVAALMGTWRRDEGIQRLALPEIQLGQLSLPNPNMSLDALNGALDFVQAKAEISDKVGRAAFKAYTDQTKPIEQRANDFLAQRDQLYAPAANPAQSIKKAREDQSTVNAPTGPKHYRIVNGQRVEIPNPQ